MKLRTLALTMIAASSLFACDALSEKIGDALPELTLGKEDGIPPVNGSTSFDVPQDFMCGDPIVDPKMQYKITTTLEGETCVFTFDQEVPVMKAADYADHPELKGATFLSRVDMQVTKLGIQDGNGAAITPKDMNGKAFGATILTMADLGKPVPFTKSIEGAPLDKLKAIVANQQDIVIPVQVQVLMNVKEMPAQINLDYDAQPNLVFGF